MSFIKCTRRVADHDNPTPFFQRKNCRSLQSHGGRLQSDPIRPCASNGLKWFLFTICYLLNITFQFVQLVKIFY